MAGYIGSKASVVSSGAERKKVFNITTSTTALTGLSYTANQVHVFHNGVRLISGTDYTETNDTTITLTNAAENGDQVVVVSYASFQTSDTVSASAGGTFSNDVTVNGDLTVNGGFTSQGIDDNATSTVITLDSSSNFLVGTTDTTLYNNTSGDGLCYRSGASLDVTAASDNCLILNRNTTDGTIAEFRKDGSEVGSIGCNGGRVYIGQSDTGLDFEASTDAIRPNNPSTGAGRDNAIDLGRPDVRFDDIFATNGTIQTSDRNEKQDIAALTATEMLVAARISAMFKTFRWIDKVADNPNARTHTGIIAQDVQQAFTDEGLDAGNYSLFISTTWTDEDGNSQTRMVSVTLNYCRLLQHTMSNALQALKHD